MLGFPSSESFNVAAFESSIKLHEMSRILIDLLSLRNSASDSQNIWPREFDERDKLSRFELLFKRSIHNFEPALSTSLFNLRLRCLRILFTFKA
jgi:hypothetical protein